MNLLEQINQWIEEGKTVTLTDVPYWGIWLNVDNERIDDPDIIEEIITSEYILTAEFLSPSNDLIKVVVAVTDVPI